MALLDDGNAGIPMDSAEKQELINLARRGKVEAVKEFLSRRGTTDLNCVNQSGSSPLMVACLNGHLDVIQLLIEKGADVNFKNHLGWSALMKTVNSTSKVEVKVKVIKLLIEHGADIAKSSGGGSALTIACRKGDVGVVSALLPEGPGSVSLHQKWMAGESVSYYQGHRVFNNPTYLSYVACPVNIAVSHSNVKLVEWFLRGGVKVPFAALFLAILDKCDTMVKVLLDGGADVNEAVNGGWTALMQASVDSSSESVVRLLVDGGASVNLQDDVGRYALLNAIEWSEFAIAQLLLKKGADYHLVTDEGTTALSGIQANSWETRLKSLLKPEEKMPFLEITSPSGKETVREGTSSEDGESPLPEKKENLAITVGARRSNGAENGTSTSEIQHSSDGGDDDMEVPAKRRKRQNSCDGNETSGEYASKKNCEDKVAFIRDVKEAITDNKLIDRKLAHSIFVGPTGSGKSSLMRRLLKRIRKQFSSSTGVSEPIAIVDLNVPSTFHPVTVVDADNWKEVEYDLSLARQMDTSFVTSPEEGVTHNPSENGSPAPSAAAGPSTPAGLPVTTTVKSSPESPMSEQPLREAEPVKIKPAVASGTNLSEEEITKLIDAVIEKCGGFEEFKESFSKKGFSLYLRDAGGQMAFQEMLSVLILGPSIFVFVFRVDVNLKKKFKGDYRDSPEQSLNCNTSSISAEEALLQCLASVYAMDTSGKAVKMHKPLVFIVGTHKDQLGPLADKKIAKMNEHLDSLVNNSSCFQDLVQYADREKGQVMFTVDNFSESDEDFKLIRTKLYSLISERSEFAIQYPVSYLLFALELQHEKRSVLKVNEYTAIASKYGIVGDRVADLLQFLHYRVGIIQYFDVEGLVMVKPQVLFNKVTDLVKRTFSLTSREANDLQKGILTESLIKEVVRDDELDFESFLKLLIRLHLATPLNLPGEQERKYFIPCVLNHVEESSDEELDTDILPLSIQFKCEHCPRGLFGVLVADLMATGLNSDRRISFSLIPDKIFRDQVSFEVYSDAADQDEMSLKALSSHLELKFFPSLCEERGLSIAEVCSAICQMINWSICKSLTDCLGYDTEKAGPVMCFKCSACHELHQVKKALAEGMPLKMFCKKFRTTMRIPAQGKCWYGEGAVPSSSSSSTIVRSVSAVSSAVSHTSIPLSEGAVTSLCEQLRLHASKWKEIGTGLQFTHPELSSIGADPTSLTNAPFSYLSEMLAIWQQWAPRDARGSKNYATLESLKMAVDRAGLGRAAMELSVD